ncbi:MAG: hypothetical protein M2R46_00330 [Verrucomicrobia subdivision 3 bacterium]|nr:hypothetical protein [Limisphaerales bacterium]
MPSKRTSLPVHCVPNGELRFNDQVSRNLREAASFVDYPISGPRGVLCTGKNALRFMP